MSYFIFKSKKENKNKLRKLVDREYMFLKKRMYLEKYGILRVFIHLGVATSPSDNILMKISSRF